MPSQLGEFAAHAAANNDGDDYALSCLLGMSDSSILWTHMYGSSFFVSLALNGARSPPTICFNMMATDSVALANFVMITTSS